MLRSEEVRKLAPEMDPLRMGAWERDINEDIDYRNNRIRRT